MSIRATVGYMKDSQFRGTYIHWAGNLIGKRLPNVIDLNDGSAVIRWVEEGIAGGGYSSIDSEPYGDIGEHLLTGLESLSEDLWIEHVWWYNPVTKKLQDVKDSGLVESDLLEALSGS